MMQIFHTGKASVEDIEKFEKDFRDFLGEEFAKEFDEKNGIVQVAFNTPDKKFSFTFPNDDIGSFIARHQEYVRKKDI